MSLLVLIVAGLLMGTWLMRPLGASWGVVGFTYRLCVGAVSVRGHHHRARQLFAEGRAMGDDCIGAGGVGL